MDVCAVDAKAKPVLIQTVRISTVNLCCCSVADIFKAALLSSAAGIILFHNYPLGEPEPSREDLRMTVKMKQAGEFLGITLQVHIIIGGDSYYNFRE